MLLKDLEVSLKKNKNCITMPEKNTLLKKKENNWMPLQLNERGVNMTTFDNIAKLLIHLFSYGKKSIRDIKMNLN